MAVLTVVGLDPSLRNWGIAKGTYDTSSQQVGIYNLDVVNTESKKRKLIRQNTQDITAATKLMTEVAAACTDADVIFIEVPVGSQSSRACVSYGICIGILGALNYLEKPFFELTPTEVKLATVGKKTASKREMISWAVNKHLSAPWPTRQLKGESKIVEGTAEHMADAVATIYAGIKSDLFKQVCNIQFNQ